MTVISSSISIIRNEIGIFFDVIIMSTNNIIIINTTFIEFIIFSINTATLTCLFLQNTFQRLYIFPTEIQNSAINNLNLSAARNTQKWMSRTGRGVHRPQAPRTRAHRHSSSRTSCLANPSSCAATTPGFPASLRSYGRHFRWSTAGTTASRLRPCFSRTFYSMYKDWRRSTPNTRS